MLRARAWEERKAGSNIILVRSTYSFFRSCQGLPRWLSGKESFLTSWSHSGDMGSIPGFGRSLEKEMATNSSNLACKIPWTVAPGGL